jgi:hypothetical protein
MFTWISVGPHRYRIAGDVLHWWPCGEVTAEHAQQVCQLFDAQRAAYGYVLWLVNATQSLPVGLDARRIYANWMATSHCKLVISVFNAPRPASTMATLVLRAVQLRTDADMQMTHVGSAAEALAILAAAREAIKAS